MDRPDLIISVATRGGSWKCLVNLTKRIQNHHEKIVISLGDDTGVIDFDGEEKVKSIIIPYDDYDRGFGRKLSGSFFSNAIYFFPLAVVSNTLVLLKRPKRVIVNGLPCAIIVSPLAKLVGAKVVCSYHGAIQGYVGERAQKMLSKLLIFVDLFIVNSQGSRIEIARIIPAEKIFPLEHTADDIFFSDQDRENARRELDFTNKFVISYIGRLDKDKLVGKLLDVAEAVKDDSRFLFILMGVGEFEERVRKMQSTQDNVRYLGYVRDRIQMASILKASDITWSYADDSYLARPAVESIASGTPVIIPNVPAVSYKAEIGVRIPNDLIPPSIGWIIDVSDHDAVKRLLVNIMEKGLTDGMRVDVAKYGWKYYSNRSREDDYQRINELVMNGGRDNGRRLFSFKGQN